MENHEREETETHGSASSPGGWADWWVGYMITQHQLTELVRVGEMIPRRLAKCKLCICP